MHQSFRIKTLAFALAFLGASSSVSAETAPAAMDGGVAAGSPAVTDPIAPAPAASPAEAGEGGWDIGGAVRFNYRQDDYTATYDEAGKLDFDTARVNVDYEKADVTASAEYRYYKGRGAGESGFVQDVFGGKGASSHFLHHAWVGHKLDENRKITVGLNPMPFGILPYASNSYFFQMPYYVGLEDTYNVGAKYETQRGDTNIQAGYYARPAPNGEGDSRDSARYSYNIVETENTRNTERNTFVGRVAHTLKHDNGGSTEVGGSLLAGDVPNRATGATGHRFAAAVHAKGEYGPWGTKLEALRYGHDLENPAGERRDVVMMGAYDFPYEVAARGTILAAGVSYTLPLNRGALKEVTLYNDFSVLKKDGAGMPDSKQNVLGAAWSVGKLFVYTDFAFGKNQPFLGPNYGTALSSGGDNEWHRRFNANIGYYF